MGGMSMYNRDDMEDMMDDEHGGPLADRQPLQKLRPVHPRSARAPRAGRGGKGRRRRQRRGFGDQGGIDAAMSRGKGLFAPSKESAAKAETGPRGAVTSEP